MTDLEEKLLEVKNVIREWDEKRGHERCWYFPELFKKIADIVGVELMNGPYVPTPEQAARGCERYWKEQFALDVRVRPEEYKADS